MAWGFASQAVTLLRPFITRTALIYVLGAEYLGISSLHVRSPVPQRKAGCVYPSRSQMAWTVLPLKAIPHFSTPFPVTRAV